MNLIVIPARGGSKRIPRKNIRPFFGHPIIAWPIQAALAANLGPVIVSTDDEEIAETACAYGATIPFMRPRDLADDHTGLVEVVQHAIASSPMRPTYACCLLPTAVFVTPDVLRKGLAALGRCDYAVSVARYDSPIQRALRIEQGFLAMREPEYLEMRSQDIETTYHDAGQFYWGRTDAWLRGQSLFDRSAPILIPPDRVQDIDTLEDWQRAEQMFRLCREQGTTWSVRELAGQRMASLKRAGTEAPAA